MIHFTVYGKAEAAGSKRPVPIGNGRYRVADANPKASEWKRLVASTAREFIGEARLSELAADDGTLLCPLDVAMCFYRQRPAGHFGAGRNAARLKDSAPALPTSKPDVLKTARAIEDALTGIVWRDDAQICGEHLHKLFGAPVRVEIWIDRPGSAEMRDVVLGLIDSARLEWEGVSNPNRRTDVKGVGW